MTAVQACGRDQRPASRPSIRLQRVVAFACGCLALPLVAAAQVRQPYEGISAGEGAGILSDVSTNVGHGSRPVKGDPTIGESSGGPIHSGPVSDSSTRSMRSGPVSSISSGPMREPRPPLSGGSVTEASAGAIKQNRDSELGTRISDPLRELGPLQEQMRARREQAEQDAMARASAPVGSIADTGAAPSLDEDIAPHLEAAANEPAPPHDTMDPQADAALEPQADDMDAQAVP